MGCNRMAGAGSVAILLDPDLVLIDSYAFAFQIRRALIWYALVLRPSDTRGPVPGCCGCWSRPLDHPTSSQHSIAFGPCSSCACGWPGFARYSSFRNWPGAVLAL